MESMLNKVTHGDCLEVMTAIPDSSVDMILCDLPYGTIKGVGGNHDSMKHGMQGKTEWDVCIDQKELLNQYNRILRANGALVLFSQDPFTAKLMTETHGNLPFSYRYTWLKDHFANPLFAKKAPVNYTEDICVFFKKYDTLGQHPLRKYCCLVKDLIGKGLKEINADLGHRRAEHFFYIDTTQFGLCTEETYNEIIDQYGIDKAKWFKSYSELKEIDSRFARRFARRFALPENSKFKSNVLSYKKDYQGLHPTQKPVKLLEDLIKTYTHENETVLDNCIGSGSTAIAAINTNRQFIGIEKDQGYFDIACKRISEHQQQMEILL